MALVRRDAVPRAWDIAWVTILAVIPLWVMHPLVRATVISTTSDLSHRHWSRATV